MIRRLLDKRQTGNAACSGSGACRRDSANVSVTQQSNMSEEQQIVFVTGAPLSANSGPFGAAWPGSSRNRNDESAKPSSKYARDSAPNSQTFGYESA